MYLVIISPFFHFGLLSASSPSPPSNATNRRRSFKRRFTQPPPPLQGNRWFGFQSPFLPGELSFCPHPFSLRHSDCGQLFLPFFQEDTVKGIPSTPRASTIAPFFHISFYRCKPWAFRCLYLRLIHFFAPASTRLAPPQSGFDPINPL